MSGVVGPGKWDGWVGSQTRCTARWLPPPLPASVVVCVCVCGLAGCIALMSSLHAIANAVREREQANAKAHVLVAQAARTAYENTLRYGWCCQACVALGCAACQQRLREAPAPNHTSCSSGHSYAHMHAYHINTSHASCAASHCPSYPNLTPAPPVSSSSTPAIFGCSLSRAPQPPARHIGHPGLSCGG